MSVFRSTGRLGVRGWFYAVIATMTVLVVLFSVIGAVLLDRASQASDTLVNRVGPARTALVDMEGALTDEETGVRGYLLSGESDFLQPYTEGQTQEVQDTAQIKSLLADSPAALAQLASVQRAVAAWRSDYAVPFIAAARAKKSVPDTEIAASKTAFDHLRAVFGTARDELTAEAAADQTHLDHLDRVRDGAFIAMLAVFLITVCLIAGLVQIAVLRPLQRLRAEAETVERGDFDAPFTAAGPHEIQVLGSALEAMRARLTNALVSAERQRAAVHRQKEVLDAQTTELRRSNEELEQFAYVASHDLQEPLRKVASFCQLIEKRYGAVLDARGKQYIDYAVDGAKRMQILINDLLAFSRVGRLNDRRERFELEGCLTDAIAGLQLAVAETDAAIRTDGPLPAVSGDATLIGMLWHNLIGNAIKFRSPDRAPEIDVAAEPDPDHTGMVRVTVTDNGIGIAPEFAEKVFIIFQRLHSREAYPGTGIGLALCKKIVEHHGGQIWIEPGRALGTRFVFTLPSAENPAEQPVQAAAPLPAARGSELVTESDHPYPAAVQAAPETEAAAP
ncbi:CHASE3 domain-containing protein [Actinospica durhamensis]|uniref:histidine kinase n=1 Tax=Actinospica durhamensis TaxID=1508375 RepID=A0A941EJ29_9ACTN|nr:sensor histidine kinase [Actinospica durhamensis]MBR7833435.1 CHASE3 domain-containing protein [Actinospica durhamensis]